MICKLAIYMIGIFDSGIGGLTVLQEIHKLCPAESTLYFADQSHIPYGSKSETDVQRYSDQICQYLITRGASVIVVACNTATAAAINWLRHRYPQVPFVGMEPAIKPAAEQTKTGRIGVLATAGTFKSQRYAQLMKRYAHQVQLFENSCIGLVEQIESGDLTGDRIVSLLRSFIGPMLAEGIDTLILGCTHYPFALPVIKNIVGADITIINPASAVAQQTLQVIEHRRSTSSVLTASHMPMHEYVTSGKLIEYIPMVKRLNSIINKRSKPGENPINATHKTFYQKVDNN